MNMSVVQLLLQIHVLRFAMLKLEYKSLSDSSFSNFLLRTNAAMCCFGFIVG